MPEIELEISERGVLIFFDQSNKDTKKLIKTLREQWLCFKTKRIYCG